MRYISDTLTLSDDVFKKLFRSTSQRYGVSMTYSHVLPHAAAIAYHNLTLSKAACQRLKWFYYQRQNRNVSKTCRYFGISRETFYYWQKRYHPWRLKTLENQRRRPHRTRSWQVTRGQELRILKLRKQYLCYGKMKLKRLYFKQYQQPISSWKIQRVIERHQLYYHPGQTAAQRRKRKAGQVKKRITELKKQKQVGFLVALDTVVRYWAGTKRYILTAIDEHCKLAYARMYPSKHAKNAQDFLKRLWYLLDSRIENLTRDNGTEFAGEFDEAVQQLKLGDYYSRPKTPTDNAVNERFNRTLKSEFIALGNMTSDCQLFNQRLTDWLIEYNFNRPHQALGYLTPMEFNQLTQVSGMYPSCTFC